ncbi:hypothetical protein EC912_103443 [Luteibacter rhizovicinus]|uniref:Tetratricopeptide repeat protein n=1 Tax=Luteibacter rhizovicinus TaxID=242606 RepID=A0A4R3YR82_9GAMM|nr:tetratricopeptide repeat protein [Luteibacter rhizovicinus]TCV94950.1 hypothetical protein EC912_103443 [Luteibacter rhizovicinus]
MPYLFRSFAIAIAFLLLASITAFAYWPGLRGPFLFDDAANLPSLGAQGPIDNSAALSRYLTSGRADPTGRPVSLLSFLADARDWPAQPRPFKLTNVLLHIVNGLLLTVLLATLGSAFDLSVSRRLIAAVIGAAMWTLHPLLVSTVLYVVQREAMLPATFTLLAMLCWLHARKLMLQGRRGGPIWLLLGAGTCTVLAVLSKANGILAPLLILITAAVVPEDRSEYSRRARRWTLTTMGPIVAIVLAQLAWAGINTIGDGPIPIRGWSVSQRLFTEPGILIDYLRQLWLLKPVDSGLFHDQYRAAKSPWDPWYTAPAIVACLSAIALAWIFRRRFPAIALAILFFFGGHLMESSSLALELYFEHRNYLPSMLMFWPLGLVAAQVAWRRVALPVAGAIILGMAALTHASALLWGNPLAQATEWALNQPDSPRAQAYAAQVEAEAGYHRQAVSRIDAAKTRFVDEPQIAFNLINLHCAAGLLKKSDLDYAATSLRIAGREPGALLSQWFNGALALARARQCNGLDEGALSTLLDAVASNPKVAAIAGRRQDIAHLRGQLALQEGDPQAALDWFNQALAEAPTPEAALAQAATLGASGYPSLGTRHLEYFDSLPKAPAHVITDGMPWLHDKVLESQNYWPNELTHLRSALANESIRIRQ